MSGSLSGRRWGVILPPQALLRSSSHLNTTNVVALVLSYGS